MLDSSGTVRVLHLCQHSSWTANNFFLPANLLLTFSSLISNVYCLVYNWKMAKMMMIGYLGCAVSVAAASKVQPLKCAHRDHSTAFIAMLLLFFDSVHFLLLLQTWCRHDALLSGSRFRGRERGTTKNKQLLKC